MVKGAMLPGSRRRRVMSDRRPSAAELMGLSAAVPFMGRPRNVKLRRRRCERADAGGAVPSGGARRAKDEEGCILRGPEAPSGSPRPGSSAKIGRSERTRIGDDHQRSRDQPRCGARRPGVIAGANRQSVAAAVVVNCSRPSAPTVSCQCSSPCLRRDGGVISRSAAMSLYGRYARRKNERSASGTELASSADSARPR